MSLSYIYFTVCVVCLDPLQKQKLLELVIVIAQVLYHHGTPSKYQIYYDVNDKCENSRRQKEKKNLVAIVKEGRNERNRIRFLNFDRVLHF